MADITSLKKRRAYIKGSMTKLLNFINNISIATTVEDIKVRLTNVERYRTEFNEIEDKIVSLNNEEELDTDFEDNYYKAVAGLNRALRTTTEPTISLNDTIVDTSTLGMHMDVKLPKLSMPYFSGKYTEWQSYHDLFCSTVHDNPRLSPSQKLQYLKGTLKDEAAKLVTHFSITDANYIEALKKLRDRYDKKKHTIHAFIKNFMVQPPVTTANNANVRQLLDTSDEILRGLKALGEEAESRDHWLIHILVSKLDGETNSLWAQTSAEYDLPTIKQFFDFLARRVDALDSLKCSEKRYPPQYNNSKPKIRSHVIAKSPEVPACSLCPKDHHRLFECSNFKAMPIEDRRNVLKTQNRCFNCLNDNHNVYSCKSKFRCRLCNRKHHTMLHENPVNQEEITVAAANIPKEDTASSSGTQIAMPTINQLGNAVLPTALVKVADENNQYQVCRVLLDSGSQGSFITERCAQRLHLRRSNAKLAISGIGAITNGYTRGAVSLAITPWNRTKPRFLIDALVFPKLTAKQQSIAQFVNIHDFKQYELADPQFYKGAEIDIIIGADTFFQLLCDGKITTDNQLILQNTLLGWVISGKPSNSPPMQSITINMNKSEDDVEELLQKFWEIEAVDPSRPLLSAEEELCENHFQNTKTTDVSGRIIVRLPFKITPSVLGDSYPKAVQRMHSIERKFKRDPEFALLYKSFMREYLELGHMKRVNKEPARANENAYYLPHHGVIKNMSSSTKLRVVFDGSAKTTTNKSLNDCLAVGPVIQSSLYEILSRFRKHKVAFTADIEKMYRQVRIADIDTKFQRIVWRDESNMPFDTYELQTVTYGTASASFLATRAVIETANKYAEDFPEAANRIKTDMYVDDLMTGAASKEEAINLKNEINKILASAGFQLRKWLSNEDTLNDNVENGISSRMIEIEESSSNFIKVLGLHWDPNKDCFRFKVNLNEEPTTTKRGILSEASRLFDPLGWLAPVTVSIKVFFQTLWAENLGWDDQLPSNMLNEWLRLRSNLLTIESIELARYLNTEPGCEIALHGFSDACKQAYSAVVYGMVTNTNGDSYVKLLSAKTKVAPVKQLSIPRLELCGAVLLTKLLLSVKQSLKSKITQIVAWTDSTIVLDWLNAHPNKWNTFVGNRTSDILSHFKRSQWKHVDSRHNPADCACRGLDPNKLKNFDLWWTGPSWLMNSANWPDITRTQSNTVEELRSQSLMVQMPQLNIVDDLIERTSSFSTVIHVIAYVYRFINLTLKRTTKDAVSSYLEVDEIHKSKHFIFRHSQSKHFSTEIKLLQSNRELPASSRIKYFKPFLDESGLLRVGGRIVNAAITYNIKHPIILTASDKLTDLLIREHHIRYLHAGPTLMMASLRHKYWIIGARSLIRKVIHSCVKCVKYSGKSQNQIMGPLPNSRVELIRPFHKVGVDYAGPFQTYVTRGRGQKSHKTYVCIFVCLATKATHIELVFDLTTEAYLAALRRFISRRGICKEIYSDNGTNFVGARNHLHQFFQFLKQNVNNFSKFLLADEISFKFIPPSAPHFGGLWEAAVKSMKYHLRRVTNGHILTIDEMTTLLTEIEAMLNSRPICALSDEDMDCLTPAHFLIGRSSTQLPENNLTDVKLSRLSRWQLIQQMNQHIWQRWRFEYLTSLHHISKWHERKSNLNIGNIVIIKDNNSPPCKWLLGKIIQIHPGTDGNVRVITIKTTNGTLKRPIHKICLLPVS